MKTHKKPIILFIDQFDAWVAEVQKSVVSALEEELEGIGEKKLGIFLIVTAREKPSIDVSVVKDERHQPKGLLGDQKMIAKYRNLILQLNHEAHRFAIAFHRRRRRKLTREYF